MTPFLILQFIYFVYFRHSIFWKPCKIIHQQNTHNVPKWFTAQKNKKLHRSVDTDAVSAESEISVYKVFKFHVIEKTSKWPIRHNSILALKEE